MLMPNDCLQVRMLVELVQQHFGDGVALQIDDDAHALAVGLVAEVGDAVEAPLVHELGDALDHARLVHLVRDLVDDDRRLAGPVVGLDRRARPHREDAAALTVGLPDRRLPADEAGGREVRSRNELHELVDGELGRLDQGDQRIAHLAQVVRRDVRRHADRDAGGAVDEQVRDLRREDQRFFGLLVEVRDELDGVLLDVRQHLLGERREPAFRVPVGGRGIAVDRAEVALAVDQRVADVPVLREPNQRVVDRGIAVRDGTS
jgi:hypothetical protein